MEVEKNPESEANVSGTRSFPFEIDLNETPSSSPPETLAGDELVTASEGGSGGGFSGSLCGSCGTAADAEAEMVVCSSCWRKFHLRCFGTKEDRKCLKCLFSNKGRKLRSGLGLLDMNASPPREADGEGFLADAQSSGHGFHGRDAELNADKVHNLISRSLNVPMPTSNMVYLENGFNLLRASVGLGQISKTGFESEQHGSNRMSNDVDISTYRGGFWPSHSSPLSFRSQIQNEVYHYWQTDDRAEGVAYPSKGLNSNRRRKQSLKLAKAAQCKDSQKIPSNRIAGISSGVDMMFQAMLPLKYVDLFVLSWGNIDPRPSYHNADQIWPVGYKSCWHDKITGSIFVSEVVDGGDIGPNFKVRRYPCSTHPIPMGSTVLWRKQTGEHLPCEVPNDRKPTFGTKDDDDDNLSIRMMLAEDYPPILENIDFGKAESSRMESTFLLQRPVSAIPDGLRPGDCIGEFLVEGRSSKLVWKMASEALLRSCTEIYKRFGILRFCCKHSANETNAKPTHTVDSLSRFCFLSGPTDIPHLIRTINEFETYSEMLMQWLRQDRFGLDLEFVQEILEQHPGVQSCAEYKRLSERCQNSSLQTVGSGFLLVKHGNVQAEEGAECPRKQSVEEYDIRKPFPSGKPVSAKLPATLIGEVLQAWEFLWRFQEVLGLEKPFTFQELENELMNPWMDSIHPGEGGGNENQSLADVSSCTGTALQKIHSSLLKVLVGELLRKVVLEAESNSDAKRGRKKGADISLNSKDMKLDMLQINGLTWPELARRYILVVLSMDGNLESADLIFRERHKILPCLQGDGGTLCGSLSGVEGMEGDALLLAEASKRVFGLVKSKDFVSIIHGEADANATGAPKTINPDSSEVPDWAQALEPVRKLPTNVGARIRKCVYEALEKSPPDWARKIMEHSISKEVYKGNASGPTKRAIVTLLAEVSHCDIQPKPCKKEKEKVKTVSTSDVIMQKCRSVLRRTAAEDEEKVFCNLLGKTHSPNDNDDEGRLGYPAMVSRPLDFRTVDARLSVGVYGGSHEAFLEDVREVLNNIRTAYVDQPELIDLVESLSLKFESMYESEVLSLVQKLNADVECLSEEAKKEIDDLLSQASESSLPKAPWDEGVCKICGVDKDDDNVLLCDTCDSEYHTYCLNPPLPKIPEGNWYCPSCVASQLKSQGACNGTRVSWSRKKRYQGELSKNFMESLTQLAKNLGSKEYWEFSVGERVSLLKFLCDETLNSSIVRKHLEQCSLPSFDLQQKLRFLSSEWKNLRLREEALFAKLGRAKVAHNRVGEFGSDRLASVLTGDSEVLRQHASRSNNISCFIGGSSQLEDSRQWIGSNDYNERTWNFSRSLPGRSFAGHVAYQQSSRDQSQVHENHYPFTHPSAELSNWRDGMSSSIQKQRNDAREESAHSPHKAKQCFKDGEADNSSVMPSPVSEGLVSSDTTNRIFNLENKSDVQSSSQSDGNILQERNQEIHSLKTEFSVLQDSIARVESELEKVYLRRDILGRDSAGRVYWSFGRPDICSLLVLDGTQHGELPEIGGPSKNNKNLGTSPYMLANSSGSSDGTVSGVHTCKWTSYQSVTEIEELIGRLKNGDEKERELKELILRWQRNRPKGSYDAKINIQAEKQPTSLELSNVGNSENLSFLASNAMIALEKKYGTGLKSEALDFSKKWGQKGQVTREGLLYRCQCLEPIWPSKHHCMSCHQTYPSEEELEQHKDGKCIARSSDKGDADSLWGKKTTNETSARKHSDDSGTGRSVKSKKNDLISNVSSFQEPECPFRYEDIVRNFVTSDSLKELAREIGLPAGSAALVPTASPYIVDPPLLMSRRKNEVNGGNESADMKNRLEISIDRISISGCMKGDGNGFTLSRCTGNDRDDASGIARLLFNSTTERHKMSSKNKSLQKLGTHCVIPESSLRRLVGRVSQVLRRLKISLLDMDAALPEDALRPSMAHSEKRSSWRAFVKSAASIYEMVQATIVLENMIKADFLRKDWWHWSSLSAAANVSTLSALALRLCTLDAAIIFDKASEASCSGDTHETSRAKDGRAPMNIETASSSVAEKSPQDVPDLPRSKTRSKKRKKDSKKDSGE